MSQEPETNSVGNIKDYPLIVRTLTLHLMNTDLILSFCLAISVLLYFIKWKTTETRFRSVTDQMDELNLSLSAKAREHEDCLLTIEQLEAKYSIVIDVDTYIKAQREEVEEYVRSQRSQADEYVKTQNEQIESIVQCKTDELNNFEKSKKNELESLERSKLIEIAATSDALNELNGKYINALEVYKNLNKQVSLYENELEVMEYGLYTPQYNFQTSEEYKLNLEKNYVRQTDCIRSENAVVCGTSWEVEGSKVKGKQMTKKYSKLMLYAFNGECDSLITKLKWNTATRTKERIIKAFENINKLGESHNISITVPFLDLKLQEMALSHEYENKKYEEKEEQRRIREQMREEEKVQKDLERAQREADEEERRYQKALNRVKDDLKFASPAELAELNEQIRLLEVRLAEAHAKKERAISLAQLTKVGHIYVISNIGSFGEDVYKIGMTRRLEPMDRIRELGDASVPFHFDVHAIIYSENAPQLEYELHKTFQSRRLNRINGRKEFFRVTLDEIESFVNEHAGAEIEFTKLAEAKEYRETLAMLESLSTETSPVKEATFPISLLN